MDQFIANSGFPSDGVGFFQNDNCCYISYTGFYKCKKNSKGKKAKDLYYFPRLVVPRMLEEKTAIITDLRFFLELDYVLSLKDKPKKQKRRERFIFLLSFSIRSISFMLFSITSCPVSVILIMHIHFTFHLRLYKYYEGDSNFILKILIC